MIALLDWDSAIFICSCKKSEGEVYSSLQNLYYTTINNVGADSYICALTTGKNTFKHKFYPEYKANRKGKILPEYLNLAREFTKELLTTVSTPDIEADDIISLYKHKYQEDAIICSPDSDFTIIPGTHYDYKKHQFYTIQRLEAEFNKYCYILSGQTKDNIKGLNKVGEKIAKKYLNSTKLYLHEATMNAYINGIDSEEFKVRKGIVGLGEEEGIRQFQLNYDLINMLKTQEDLDRWNIKFNFVEPCSKI